MKSFWPTTFWRRLLVLMVLVLGSTGIVLAGVSAYRWHRDRPNALVASEKDMPIIGYALTRNGRDYTAYLRWQSIRFPNVGEKLITECRLRFSLENGGGPPGFAIRAFGQPIQGSDSLPPESPRCQILPIPQPSNAPRARVRLPDEQPLGVGDVDGSKADYNDLGCFINGELHIWPTDSGRLNAQVWLTWTGIRGDDLGCDEAQYRLSLEPISDPSQLKVFKKGDRRDGKTPIWEKNIVLLDELAKPRYRIATLGEAATLERDEKHVTVFLRHDMDLTMYGSLQMAEYEHRRGLRWSYLLNMASSIYAVQARNGRYKVNPMAMENLQHLKQLGHEIGYQNDGVVQIVEFNTPMVAWMAHEIGRLRRAGLPVSSEIPNGSEYSDRHKLWNGYLFANNREGGANWFKGHLYRNGADGKVTVQRDKKEVSYAMPNITPKQAGFTVTGGDFPNRIFTSAGYGSYSDVECTMDELVEKLRSAPIGKVLQVMTHDCRCTTWDPVIDLTVDPAYAELYRD